MRISIVSVNYAPETFGIAPYTTGMAVGLAARGHDVEVLTGLPHYPEWRVKSLDRALSGTTKVIDVVRVRRFRHYVPVRPTTANRILFESTFGARVISRRWNRPEVVVTTSPPLIASAMVIARARAARIPVGIVVQDLYGKGVTETAAMTGGMASTAMRFEAAIMNRANSVAVVHDRFARAVEEMGVDPKKVSVIRNWAHVAPPSAVDVAQVRRARGWSADERIVLHTGNMGAKQGLENVVAAARLADERKLPIRFVLVGDGNQRQMLEVLGQDVQRLEFKAPLAADEFQKALAAADVLLVNELRGVGEMAVPSKLTSYFTAGRPVLAATDVNGVTAQEIRDSGGGVVVEAGHPVALLEAALKLAGDVKAGCRMGAAGQQYAARLLGPELAIDGYEDWCHRLTDGGSYALSSVTRPGT